MLVCLAAAELLLPAETHVEIAGRDVAVWKPETIAPPRGFPVILFSHGFAGCNTQSKFLMEALADDGYLVVAPNHADSHCSPVRENWRMWRYLNFHPEKPFNKPEEWTDATYRARLLDVRATLDAVLGGDGFQGIPVDSARVGIAGHSLGGYTALGVAGAWPLWTDARIKAVLAMSPYAAPFLAGGDLSAMRAPVMYQGGTLDWGITPLVRKPGGAYDLTASPKYYVELSRAGHLAWTNFVPMYR
jgi:predicted dienelactone hydrolase